MSSKSPRVFSRDFKIDICRQIQSGQKRPAQVCREHQLSESVLLRWRHEFEQNGEAAFGGKAFPLPESSSLEATAQRVAELERYCGQLSMENMLLKKALARVPRSNGTH